ncbi:MAG: hypothetical protein H6735_23070 [Alphaproteobacteria bacterium]|nr:hypothetical protein [Alphaproteobacteria bacterium]
MDRGPDGRPLAALTVKPFGSTRYWLETTVYAQAVEAVTWSEGPYEGASGRRAFVLDPGRWGTAQHAMIRIRTLAEDDEGRLVAIAATRFMVDRSARGAAVLTDLPTSAMLARDGVEASPLRSAGGPK